MDPEGQVAEGAESTPAAEPQGTPAGAQNTAQTPEAQVPFHQHPRWQQMMGELRELRPLRQEYTRLQQEFAQLRASQQQNGRPQATQEQLEAIRVLRELQGLDPESAKQQERLDRIEQALQGMVQSQQTALTTQGRAQLAQMASESGLPSDAKSLAVIENAVTVYLADKPEAVQRFRNHDLSVIKDAFKEFNDTFLGKLRRETTAAVVEKKTAATAIPTPPRGGLPGPAAPVKVTAQNEPEVRQGIRDRLRTALMSIGQE